MPQFTDKEVEKYIDDFFASLPPTIENQSNRVRGAVCFALLDDRFREEIAEPMEDVRIAIIQAEEYIQARINSVQ